MDYVNYTCNEAYEMVSVSTKLQCRDDKTWQGESDDFPKCESETFV